MELFEGSSAGRFDPSHFGLWISLDRVLDSERAQEMLELTWPTYHFPLNKKHREFVQNCQPQEELLAIQAFTVFSHETKHFHDLLVTAYGSLLMRQYARAAVHCAMCQSELLIHRESIVIPLSDWFSAPEVFESGFSVRPPGNNLKFLYETLGPMRDKVRGVDQGLIPLDPPFDDIRASSILESLAILTQEELIAREFGEDSMKVFRSGFSEEAQLEYYGALGLVNAVLGSRYPLEVVRFILLVSLCGNFQDPNPDHLRAPKDILIDLLIWLRDRKFQPNSISGFEDLIGTIDEYFEEKYDTDLQGNIIQASKTNDKVETALLEELDIFERETGKACHSGRRVVEAFSNFKHVQAAFAANVMINPHWYCSSLYLENQMSLPTPIIFVESEGGLPISEELESIYYVQSESRIHSDTTASQFPNLVDNEGVIRLGHVFSPRQQFTKHSDIDEAIPWWYEVAPIDFELWQKSYDEIGSILRVLLDGENAPAKQVEMFIFALGTLGTRVFSSRGELTPAELPVDSVDSPVVDPVVRKYYEDPMFRDGIEALRSHKDQRFETD